MREFCRVAELRARLRGEIDEKTITNVLHVHFDADTAKRVAETYLARTRKVNRMNDYEEILRLAHDDLACYAVAMWPEFDLAAHHELIVDRLAEAKPAVASTDFTPAGRRHGEEFPRVPGIFPRLCSGRPPG